MDYLNNVLNYYNQQLNNLINVLPTNDPIFIKVIFGLLSLSIFFIVITTIFVIYRIKDDRSIIGKLKQANESIYTEALKNVQENKTTKTFYEIVDLLLSRSQVKYYFRFNFWHFITLSILFFMLGLYTFNLITDMYLPSLAIGIGFGFIPYIVLEIIAGFKGKQVKNQVLTLIPILINNAKLTNGDVYLMMKRSIEKTKEPIKIYLEEFVDEYEAGIKIEKCFEHLKDKIMDYRFTRLIDCLENHLYKGGNVVVTLNSIQKEYLAREIEEDRRKKENLSSVLGVYICVISNIGIVYLVNMVMPEVFIELKSTKFQTYMFIAVINTMISLFIAFKSSKIGSVKK